MERKAEHGGVDSMIRTEVMLSIAGNNEKNFSKGGGMMGVEATFEKGAVALERSVILDIFTPQRRDFLE